METENPIFRSLEQIEGRISEKLTVENIARAVFFSKFHYQRLFREIVGDSVMEYVTKRRLTLAGRALLETDAAIVDIALEYGYDSREGFTRSFKTYMGVSPTEYRKYGLTAISQKTIKERFNTTYSKNTDDIVRELNDYIAKAKETAITARKLESPAKAFWMALADKIDTHTDSVKKQLERISSIAEHPDEITNRFEIVKAIEDAAFGSNIFALNAGLMAARSLPEHAEPQKQLAAQCLELARNSVVKSSKVVAFFNELATLIFDDMRKAAADKIAFAVSLGRKASEQINGYDYIKNEIVNLTNELEAKALEDISVSWFDDCLFKLRIIATTAELQDVPRNPAAKPMFSGIAEFSNSLRETLGFFDSLARQDPAPTKQSNAKFLQDISYQGNILLFYLRGEVEKLGQFLSAEQKAAFADIDDNIDGFIRFAQSVTDDNAFRQSAIKLLSISKSITEQADQLYEHGGAVRLLAAEFNGLASAVTRLATN